MNTAVVTLVTYEFRENAHGLLSSSYQQRFMRTFSLFDLWYLTTFYSLTHSVRVNNLLVLNTAFTTFMMKNKITDILSKTSTTST